MSADTTTNQSEQLVPKAQVNNANHVQQMLKVFQNPLPVRQFKANYNPTRQSNSANFPNFCSIILIVAALILFIFFLVDLRTQHEKEKRRVEVQKMQCLRHYNENHCHEPVQILQLDCKNWRECYHSPTKVNLTVVFIKVIRNMLEQLGIISAVLLLVLCSIYFWNHSKNNKQHAKHF